MVSAGSLYKCYVTPDVMRVIFCHSPDVMPLILASFDGADRQKRPAMAASRSCDQQEVVLRFSSASNERMAQPGSGRTPEPGTICYQYRHFVQIKTIGSPGWRFEPKKSPQRLTNCRPIRVVTTRVTGGSVQWEIVGNRPNPMFALRAIMHLRSNCLLKQTPAENSS